MERCEWMVKGENRAVAGACWYGQSPACTNSLFVIFQIWRKRGGRNPRAETKALWFEQNTSVKKGDNWWATISVFRGFVLKRNRASHAEWRYSCAVLCRTNRSDVCCTSATLFKRLTGIQFIMHEMSLALLVSSVSDDCLYQLPKLTSRLHRIEVSHICSKQYFLLAETVQVVTHMARHVPCDGRCVKVKQNKPSTRCNSY